MEALTYWRGMETLTYWREMMSLKTRLIGILIFSHILEMDDTAKNKTYWHSYLLLDDMIGNSRQILIKLSIYCL